MTLMIAADVIVVPELAIVVARIPVARRRHAVHQSAVVEHRQIESAAVPGNELRRVLFDPVEKAPEQLSLAVRGGTQRPAAEAVSFAQRAGDGNDPMQVQGQKVLAGLRAPLLESVLGDVPVGELGVQIAKHAQAGDVRHRLDIECEDRRHSPAR